ncbi:MAG: hypothetical protein DRN25_00985 [Thermoplasmata archaeon]|nr:MAG: hypothetical protein DRN25_00985 [Thermoplasmata archaeon]
MRDAEKILVALYFKEAFSESSAIQPMGWMKRETIDKLVEKGFLSKYHGKISLTLKGTNAAMLIVRKKIDSGEGIDKIKKEIGF